MTDFIETTSIIEKILDLPTRDEKRTNKHANAMCEFFDKPDLTDFAIVN